MGVLGDGLRVLGDGLGVLGGGLGVLGRGLWVLGVFGGPHGIPSPSKCTRAYWGGIENFILFMGRCLTAGSI